MLHVGACMQVESQGFPRWCSNRRLLLGTGSCGGHTPQMCTPAHLHTTAVYPTFTNTRNRGGSPGGDGAPRCAAHLRSQHFEALGASTPSIVVHGPAQLAPPGGFATSAQRCVQRQISRVLLWVRQHQHLQCRRRTSSHVVAPLAPSKQSVCIDGLPSKGRGTSTHFCHARGGMRAGA